MFSYLTHCKSAGAFLLITMMLFSGKIFADPVLNKILSTHSITLAWVDNTRPISWQFNNKPSGMAIDICLDVVQSIEKRYNTKLNVTWMKIPAAARFEIISDNHADILCAVAANSVQRNKIVNFSIPWFYTKMNFLAKKPAQIMNEELLSGHTVGVISGGTSALELAKMNEIYNYSISVRLVRDFNEGFGLLADGHISAFITDDVIIRGKLAEMPNKEDYRVSQEGFGNTLEYGLVVAKNADEMEEIINSKIKSLFASKRFDELYNKWFMSPLTSPEDNVQLPMSQHLLNDKLRYQN